VTHTTAQLDRALSPDLICRDWSGVRHEHQIDRPALGWRLFETPPGARRSRVLVIAIGITLIAPNGARSGCCRCCGLAISVTNDPQARVRAWTVFQGYNPAQAPEL
jgi:hypothetical protein